MKILVLSDTHGDIHPAIIELGKDCDLAIHCGDIGTSEVLDTLQEHAKVIAVRGNNDMEAFWPEADHQRLQAIPWEASIELGQTKIGFCHGHQEPSVPKRHAYLRSQFNDCNIIAYGHSHHLVVDDEDNERIVINPGAAGRARTNGGPSCLVLESNDKKWSIVGHRFTW